MTKPCTRLLLEAGALIRDWSSPVARRTAAREAAQISAAELVAPTEDLTRILFAMREIVIAVAIVPDHRRRHLVDALESCIAAARAQPPQPQAHARAAGEPRRFWLESN